MTPPVTPGARLRKAREAAHLTQQRVAELSGLSLGTVCRVERGRDALASTVERIEKAIEQGKKAGVR